MQQSNTAIPLVVRPEKEDEVNASIEGLSAIRRIVINTLTTDKWQGPYPRGFSRLLTWTIFSNRRNIKKSGTIIRSAMANR